MKKMFFAEPEMEVVHFDAEDVIATSGGPCCDGMMAVDDTPVEGGVGG